MKAPETKFKNDTSGISIEFVLVGHEICEIYGVGDLGCGVSNVVFRD